MRGMISCLITAGLLLHIGEATARADDTAEAREHFKRGVALYDEGQYQAAVSEFEAANRLRPSPVLHYNIGRSYDRLGRAREAVAGYRRYLEGRPAAANRAEVERRIAALNAELESEEESAPPVVPPTAKVSGEELEEEASAQSPPAPGAAAGAAGGEPAPGAELEQEAAGEPPQGGPLPPFGAEGAEPQAGKEPAAGKEAGAVEHEAAMAGKGWGQSQKEPAARRPAPRQPAPAPPPHDSPPIYKQWWFWVACAGGAVIVGFIVATAVSKDDPAPRSATGALTAPPAGGFSFSF